MAKAKDTSKSKPKGKRNATSFTSETAKAANKKSRESARRNRSMKEWAKFYGAQHIKLPMPDKTEIDATWDGAVVVGLYRSAMAGNAKAAKFLAELSGQAPAQQIEANVNLKGKVKTEKDLSPEEAARFVAELNKHI